MFARIRKAVIAGLGAGVGAGVAVIAKANWSFDNVTISQALGTAVAVGGPVGYATFRVPNKA